MKCDKEGKNALFYFVLTCKQYCRILVFMTGLPCRGVAKVKDNV